MKVALTSGAYEARSIIANAQRCVNLYPEQNQPDAPFPATYYPTPGLRLLGSVSDKVWRGLYAASNGALFGVCGTKLYKISPEWAFTEIGAVDDWITPVMMNDNGVTMLLVDGTHKGYTVKLETDEFAQIDDENFYGSDRAEMVDGFFVLNRPASRQFYISIPNSTTFDALDFVAKSGYSDNLVTVGVINRNIWLFGELTTEVFYNTGEAAFPFARYPGVFMQHGCGARYSIAGMDNSLYWLAKNPQGHGIVMRSEGMQALRISTHAIEDDLRSYPRIDDAIGFTYQQDGHMFYVLTFPEADKTWCYDLSTQLWHERAFLGEKGFERHRANCHATWRGMNIVGDRTSGDLYAFDLDKYTDDTTPIQRVRSFPHMVDNGNRIHYRKFIADMEVGNGLDASSDAPNVYLRWSDTRGVSWGNQISASMGARGQYLTSVLYQRLGTARDRVFELSWSAPVRTALNGAFIDVIGGAE